MKNLIFIILFLPSLSFGKNINLNILDDQVKVMENDLADVEQWIKDVVLGKYGKCLSRAAEEERHKLKAEGATSMPVDEKALADNLFKRPTYKNRKDREAEIAKP